jgi:hypothetical protein
MEEQLPKKSIEDLLREVDDLKKKIEDLPMPEDIRSILGDKTEITVDKSTYDGIVNTPKLSVYCDIELEKLPDIMTGSQYDPTYIDGGFNYNIQYIPENYKKELLDLKKTLKSLSSESGTIQYIIERKKDNGLVQDDNDFIKFLKEKYLKPEYLNPEYLVNPKGFNPSIKFKQTAKFQNFTSRSISVNDNNAAFFIISHYADTYKQINPSLYYGEFPTKEKTIIPFLVKFYKEHKTPGLESDIKRTKEKVETLLKQISNLRGGSRLRRKSRKPTRKSRRTSHRRKNSRKHYSSP